MSEGNAQPAGGLPALLAEYGQLVAGLRSACPEQAGRVRERLAELDAAIDGCVAELDIPACDQHAAGCSRSTSRSKAAATRAIPA